MKNLLVMMFALALGLECFAEGHPFTEYKEKGYTAKEAAGIVSKDSLLANEYRLLFQQLAEKDGWADNLDQKKVSFGNVVAIIEKLRVVDTSWKSGEVVVSSRNGKGGFKRFTRPSYSDRVKKTLGKEPVGLLDITSITGWKDKNGNPFPVRIVTAMRCINSIFDMRYQILPTSPLVKITSVDDQPDTVFLVTHDTIWVEKEDYDRTENYRPRYNGTDYYYEVPTFTYHFSAYGSCCGYSWYFPTYTYCCGHNSCPPQVFNNYNTSYYNSYTYNQPRVEQGQGQDPPPPDPGGVGIDPLNRNVGAVGGRNTANSNSNIARSTSTVRNENARGNVSAARSKTTPRYVDMPSRQGRASRNGSVSITNHPTREATSRLNVTQYPVRESRSDVRGGDTRHSKPAERQHVERQKVERQPVVRSEPQTRRTGEVRSRNLSTTQNSAPAHRQGDNESRPRSR